MAKIWDWSAHEAWCEERGLVFMPEEKEEVMEMADDLADKMAEMTIGVEEDEIADAQGTMHDLRVVKAKREEQVELLMAEKRRIEFALAELSGRHD